MRIARLDKNNKIIEITDTPYDVNQTYIRHVPNECEIGDIYIDNVRTPRQKTKQEITIDALIKAVLTGDKTDLNNI